MESVKSLQWSWYNDKEHLRHLTNKATSANPRDPKDSCNVIIFDFLNFEENSGTESNVRGSFLPSNATHTATTNNTAKKRLREDHEVRAKQQARPIAAPDSAPSASTFSLQLQVGRSGHLAKGPAISLDDALLFLVDEAATTTALTTPSSVMTAQRDDTQKSILASYLKRVDWIESQRSLGTFHDLTPAEKAQREIEATLKKRKQFSRDRKATD